MIWAPRIVRESVGGVTILEVAGRLGSASSGALVEALVGAIDEGARRLLVDLTAVDYASSAGLRALDAAAGRMHAAGGTLVLCGLTEPIRLALDLSGLLGEFAVAASREAGIASLGAAEPARPAES